VANVLVIDDDAQFRLMLRRTLEHAGHDVVDAEDGPQGVAAFVEHPSQVAIVDLYMPEQTGWETIRELRARASDLPFVIVTGGGAMEPVARGGTSILDALRAANAVRILRKPFEREALVDALDGLLASRAGA
jgi:CheY-like chemotaxis protein